MLLVITDMQNFLFNQIILLSSWNIQISFTFFIIDSWVNEKGYIAALVAVLVICLFFICDFDLIVKLDGKTCFKMPTIN